MTGPLARTPLVPQAGYGQMVDPAAQREGIGRVILQQLVVKATRAWLVTLPDSPASQVYLSSGWQPQRPRFPLCGREVETWALGI